MVSVIVQLIAFSVCVHKSYSTCSDGHDEVVEGLVGQNVNLSCDYSGSCFSTGIIWRNYTSSLSRDISPFATPHTAVRDSQGRRSFLSISGITFDDNGSYQCRCKEPGSLRFSSPICRIRLATFCQAKVLVNGETNFFNGNLTSSLEHIIDVIEGDRIVIECQDGVKLKTNCSRSNEQLLTTSAATVIPAHNCLVECRLFSEHHPECRVSIRLRAHRDFVSTSTTSRLQTQTSNVVNQNSINPQPYLLIPLVLMSVFASLVILAIIGFILFRIGIFCHQSNSSDLAVDSYDESSSRLAAGFDQNENVEGTVHAKDRFDSIRSVEAQHICTNTIDPIGEADNYLYEDVPAPNAQDDDEGIVIVDISEKNVEDNNISSRKFRSEDKYCYY